MTKSPIALNIKPWTLSSCQQWKQSLATQFPIQSLSALGVFAVTPMINQKKHIKSIVNVLVEHLNPQRIWLFGSRAGADFTDRSDFDIAIEGHEQNHRKLRKAKDKLDEVLGIYQCDLIEYENASPEFRSIIRKGQLIYSKSDQDELTLKS